MAWNMLILRENCSKFFFKFYKILVKYVNKLSLLKNKVFFLLKLTDGDIELVFSCNFVVSTIQLTKRWLQTMFECYSNCNNFQNMNDNIEMNQGYDKWNILYNAKLFGSTQVLDSIFLNVNRNHFKTGSTNLSASNGSLQ